MECGRELISSDAEPTTRLVQILELQPVLLKDGRRFLHEEQ